MPKSMRMTTLATQGSSVVLLVADMLAVTENGFFLLLCEITDYNKKVFRKID